MARRGRKGGRAVQLKRLKRELCASGNFDPEKVFPKEIPTYKSSAPKVDNPPPSKTSFQSRTPSSTKPRPQPSAKDTFCPTRIPTRPRRPLAPIIKNKNKPKIVEQARVDGLVKAISSEMFMLNIKNK